VGLVGLLMVVGLLGLLMVVLVGLVVVGGLVVQV
jgi:hypothetical protein